MVFHGFSETKTMTDLFDSSYPLDAARTLALYHAYYRENWQKMPVGQAEDMRYVSHLSHALDGLDGLILDSYGVIGLGSAPITGIHALFDAAAAQDIPIVILTNGASQPAERRVAGYRAWDLPIVAQDIISSRDAAYQLASEIHQKTPEARFSYLGANVRAFDDIPGSSYDHSKSESDWDRSDYYLFLGATGWTLDDQNRLEAALQATSGTVIVGNPDVSAPVDGSFTFEPGFWAMKAQQATGTRLIMTGKPFAPAYELAFAALEKKAGTSLDKAKVGMVGDSLHTDILGAKSFGLHAILLSGYGLMAGRDIAQETASAGIYPDMVATYL